MNIGVYFNTNSRFGGVHQYALSLLHALQLSRHRVTIFNLSKEFPKEFRSDSKFCIIPVIQKRENQNEQNTFSASVLMLLGTYVCVLFFRLGLTRVIRWFYLVLNKKIYSVINSSDAEIIIFPVLTFEILLCNKPFIVCIHDLQHKLQPRFKEVSSGGQYGIREMLYHYTFSHAVHLISESNVGKNDIVSLYRINPKKISVLPYIATPTLDKNVSPFKQKIILQKFKLKNITYIFYPANFWPHKNHINLVKALSFLIKRHDTIHLILTGTKDVPYSTYKEVMALIKKLKLNDYIHYLGYISDEEISVIYKTSQALVMPTYFWPTSIPVIEAWDFGIPVATSNIHGIKEIVGEASLLFNPDSPSDIEKKISIILTNNAIRNMLIKNGKRKIISWTIADFSSHLEDIIDKQSQRQLV